MMKNSKLKNLIRFSHKVTCYIPGTIGANTEADTTQYVDQTAIKLSEWFGGATSTLARGYWVSPVHGLIKETTTLVFAYADEASLIEHSDELVDYLSGLKATMQQESIALELDGEMMFI